MKDSAQLTCACAQHLCASATTLPRGSSGSSSTPSSRAAATPAEVKAVLSEEDYEAFERLSLQQSLQSMKDVFVCPRCEYPAILQEEGGRLAICGECHFSFCVECRCAWHGLSACANLAARWRKAGPAERDALTAKYGAKMVEEVQSAELIEGTTKPCVNCGTPIEKNGGCNCTPRAAAASALCVPRRPARPVPKLTSLASGRGRDQLQVRPRLLLLLLQRRPGPPQPAVQPAA